jgi:prephenate dehydrogenase (NADP+)
VLRTAHPGRADAAADSPLTVWRDGHYVSRRSDLIIYSVEAAYIDAVVGLYGPCE